MSTQYLSQFHKSEITVQKKLGVAERVAPASQYIREFMPEQHREFFSNLPYIVMSMVDKDGQPWPIPIFGKSGFISSPVNTRLNFATLPKVTKLFNIDFSVGQKVGTVGVDVETRRRNRMNGYISDISHQGFSVDVDLSFGNCPQYIQKRDIRPVDDSKVRNRFDDVVLSNVMDKRTQSLIESMDTFYIASRTKRFSKDKRTGLDASHRGGKPGFVKATEKSLLFPDFSGNKFFNTLGNIASDPRVGLVFPDFHTTDAVFVTGKAKIHFEHPELENVQGAERIIEINVERVAYVDSYLPMQGKIKEYSPTLGGTGIWSDVKSSQFQTFEIMAKQPESNVISSFYLAPKFGNATADYIPGQFLPLEITLPNQKSPLRRSYTLSQAPKPGVYRISVKREIEGAVSRALHDTFGIGSYVNVGKPAGSFTLQDNQHSIVLVSGGVGITPMIAMLEGLVARAKAGDIIQPVWFFHATQNSLSHAFSKQLMKWEQEFEWLTVFTAYSKPMQADNLGTTYHLEGRLSIDTFKQVLPFDRYDFYLCGSDGFMKSIYQGLKNLGVSTNAIFYEFFGNGSLGDEEETQKVAAKADVNFTKSDVSGEWTPSSGTLLEFAENNGLEPSFSCRNGSCGTCACNLKSGEVTYGKQPAYQIEEGKVLICCAKPAEGSKTVEIEI